jgi:hypothetical protein
MMMRRCYAGADAGTVLMCRCGAAAHLQKRSVDVACAGRRCDLHAWGLRHARSEQAATCLQRVSVGWVRGAVLCSGEAVLCSGEAVLCSGVAVVCSSEAVTRGRVREQCDAGTTACCSDMAGCVSGDVLLLTCICGAWTSPLLGDGAPGRRGCGDCSGGCRLRAVCEQCWRACSVGLARMQRRSSGAAHLHAGLTLGWAAELAEHGWWRLHALKAWWLLCSKAGDGRVARCLGKE